MNWFLRHKRVLTGAAALMLSVLAACAPAGNAVTALPEETSAAEASGEAEQERSVILSLASGGDWTDSAQGKILADLLSQLETDTGGKVKIVNYDRYRLGDDVRIVHGVQLGTLDLYQAMPGAQTSTIPEAALLEVPGLFDTLEEWNAFLSGPYLDVMRGYYKNAGIRLITAFAYSYRELSSNREIRVPADLKGLRIRVIENEYHETFWESMGAKAVPYSFKELRFCLQEGLADAQENAIGAILSENLIGLQSSVTLTEHVPMIYILGMNEAKYDSLTEEEKAAVEGFAEKLRTALTEQLPQREAEILETLRNDYGMTVLPGSAIWDQAVSKAADDVIALLRDNLGERKVDLMLTEAERIRNLYRAVQK